MVCWRCILAMPGARSSILAFSLLPGKHDKKTENSDKSVHKYKNVA